MEKLVILIFALGPVIPVISTCPSYDVLTEWETVIIDDGIELQHRWLSISDSIKVRQSRALFEINDDVYHILKNFKQEEKLTKWMPGSKTCKIVDLKSENWTIYTLLDIPWPFKQRDQVTNYSLVMNKNQTIIFYNSANGLYPEQKEVIRMKDFYGKWIFNIITSEKTKVEFYSLSLTEPLFPRTIQDPIIQKIILNSLHQLKLLSEGQV